MMLQYKMLWRKKEIMTVFDSWPIEYLEVKKKKEKKRNEKGKVIVLTWFENTNIYGLRKDALPLVVSLEGEP